MSGWSSQVVIASQVIIEGSADGLFVYNGAPALGNLIVSAAAQAGTDAQGNAYPQGLSVTVGVIAGTTITGSVFEGTDFVLDQNGMRFYSGTPALGNLIASMAPTASTDSFGNGYVAGLAAYDGAVNDVFTALQAGQILVGTIANHIPDTADAGLIAPSINGITNSLGIESPTNVSEFQPVLWQAISGNGVAGTGQPGVPHVLLTDSTSVQPVDQWMSGTALQTDVSGTPLTWQDPTLLLGTGWAIGPSSGTVQKLQYRKDALDNLFLVGAVHSTSATPATTLFTLPSGYRPAVNQRVVAVSNAAGTPSVRFIEINSNGGVLIMTNIGTSGTDVYINSMIPRGNIS